MDDTARSVDERSEAIRSEIEQTRDEMAETIDAIQDKLRPSTFVANAKERVKSAATERVRAMADTAEEAASTVMNRTRDGAGGVMEFIRANPYPVTFIGIGTAWLLMSRSGNSGSRRSFASGTYGRDYERFGSSYSGAEYGRQGYSGTQYQNTQYGDTQYGNTAYGDRQAGEISARAREYAGETAEAIRRTGRQAQNQFQRMLYENPLLVGAGALMLGAAFGLAVPETEKENELMGDMRDSMIERAQDLAGQAASKVQETANQVADAAANVAQSVSGEPKPQS